MELLPKAVIYQICENLSTNDLIMMLLMSKLMYHKYIKDETLWRNQYKREFPEILPEMSIVKATGLSFRDLTRAAFERDGKLYFSGRNPMVPMNVETESLKTMRIVEVEEGIRFSKTYCGEYHHYAAIDENGRLFMWGNNRTGRLLLDRISDTNIVFPCLTTNGGLNHSIITSCALGWKFTAILTSAGEVFCWGTFSKGKEILMYSEPVNVVDSGHIPLKFVHISAAAQLLIVGADGKLYVLGTILPLGVETVCVNEDTGFSMVKPPRMDIFFVACSCSNLLLSALAIDGSMFIFGRISKGARDPTRHISPVMIRLDEFSPPLSLAAGPCSVFAIQRNGRLIEINPETKQRRLEETCSELEVRNVTCSERHMTVFTKDGNVYMVNRPNEKETIPQVGRRCIAERIYSSHLEEK